MVFQPGKSGNPAGKPPATIEFVPRVRNFLNNYTGDEIRAIRKNKREYGKLTAMDTIIINRIYDAMDGENQNATVTLLMDRILGKPAHAVTVDSNVNVNMQINKAERQIRQLPRETIMAMKELIDNAKTSGMITTTYTDVTEDESQ